MKRNYHYLDGTVRTVIEPDGENKVSISEIHEEGQSYVSSNLSRLKMKPINVKELREFRPKVYYKDGENITLGGVQEAIEDCAAKMGIPVAFFGCQVKSGGVFNATIENCIVMYHPQHENDYVKFCIRVKHQGRYAFISVDDFGKSKQLTKAALAESYTANRKGQTMSFKVGSMIGQGIRTIGKNQAKLEEEQMYYQCVYDLFDEIIS